MDIEKRLLPPCSLDGFMHFPPSPASDRLWPFSREEEIVSGGRICYQYGNFDVTNARDAKEKMFMRRKGS
jgi:hypothetical protein